MRLFFKKLLGVLDKGKCLFALIFSAIKYLFRRLVLVFITLVGLWALIGFLFDKYEFNDYDPARGAAAITSDPFDSPVVKENITNLEQGWSEAESMWFYTATQGSNLVPYDFFMSLEQVDNTELFRSNTNINKYRYLPQDVTKSNPDGLPIGMVKDTYQGKEYMGFNCAACHTSQINYKGKAVRVDGGPAASDMENFLLDLTNALETTLNDSKKYERFYQRVTEIKGDYHERSSKDLKNELEAATLKLRTYTDINKPSWKAEGESGVTHYGYSRLDAFGRIYNRVLQHVINPEAMSIAIRKYSDNPTLAKQLTIELSQLSESNDRTNIVARSLELIDMKAESNPQLAGAVKDGLLTGLFNPPNAPVSYPYLWDIPHHDYVQWTGMVSNGGIGPLGRNVGQVIGVFGTLDWQEKPGWSLNALLGGQGKGSSHVDFKSSIDKRNLRRVESQLKDLKSPLWPSNLFGPIADTTNGERIFNIYCESCHSNIVRDDPDRRVLVHMSSMETVGTDPILSENTTEYRGYSGILQDQYVDLAPGKYVVEERMPAASLVKIASRNVVTKWDADRNILVRSAQWTWDMIKTIRDNSIKHTVKRGDYPESTPQQPLAEMNAYKARALNGIWSTAPYLHNGSVPNLYQLLLPKKRPGDPEVDSNGDRIEYRSDRFMVGSREFDPKMVGFKLEGYEGFLFDTSIRGNSNAGHNYGTDGSDNLPILTKPERLELLEYLKSL